jgi:hypothetical protein
LTANRAAVLAGADIGPGQSRAAGAAITFRMRIGHAGFLISIELESESTRKRGDRT